MSYYAPVGGEEDPVCVFWKNKVQQNVYAMWDA